MALSVVVVAGKHQRYGFDLEEPMSFAISARIAGKFDCVRAGCNGSSVIRSPCVFAFHVRRAVARVPLLGQPRVVI